MPRVELVLKLCSTIVKNTKFEKKNLNTFCSSLLKNSYALVGSNRERNAFTKVRTKVDRKQGPKDVKKRRKNIQFVFLLLITLSLNTTANKNNKERAERAVRDAFFEQREREKSAFCSCDIRACVVVTSS